MLLIEHQTSEYLVHINTQSDPIIFQYKVYRQIGKHITLQQQGNFFVYSDTVIREEYEPTRLVIDNTPYSCVTIPIPGLLKEDKSVLLSFARKIKHHAQRTA